MSARNPDRAPVGKNVFNTRFEDGPNYGVQIGNFFAGEKHPLDWLSNFDFSNYPQSHLKSKVEGTCDWFLSSNQFNSWIGGESVTLWCPGNAGTGKTYIVSIVILHLQVLHPVDPIRVTYFYFEQSRKNEQSPTKVFGSLLKQLVVTTPWEKYSEPVKTMWNTYDRQQTYPSFETLITAIKSQAAMYQKVFIILDALDESPGLQGDAGAWSEMKKGIRNLCESDKISFMITSRSHVDSNVSVDLLKGTNHLKMEISAHEDDVRSYARDKVQKSARLKELQIVNPSEDVSDPDELDLDDLDINDMSSETTDVDNGSLNDTDIEGNSMPLIDQIVEAVVNAAQGIFLLATFHMRAIESCTTINEIRQLLAHLPNDIEEAYDEILGRIEARSTTESTLAKVILPWICCALRPMTMTELRCALAISPPKWIINKNDIRPPSVVLSVCEGFIVLGAGGEMDVRFVHSTAQDYIADRLAQFPNARSRISGSCIGYLSSKKFTEPPSDSDEDLEERLRRNKFLLYAACNWGHHLQQYEGDSTEAEQASANPIDMAVNMIQNDNLLLNLSQISYIPAFRQRNYSQNYPRQVTGLHFAARYGTGKLLQKLIDKLVPETIRIDSRDTYQKTPLHIAARMGHSKISETLLAHEANIEAATGDGETPLLGAAMNGDLGSVKLLLEHNANVEMRNKPGGTALHWASLNGNPDVVGQLLDHKADIAAIANAMATVQYGIDSVGFEAMVWLLLDKLASAGLKNLLGGTALHWAAFNGHHRVVELLANRGADVNAKNLMHGTPLHAASWNGNEKAVKVLLDHKALLSERTALGNTALREACLNGNKTVAKLLLTHGADALAEEDLVDGLTDLTDKDKVAAVMTAKGVEVQQAADKDEGKGVLEAVVKLVAYEDVFAQAMMRAMLQAAIEKGDDTKGWNALREVTAKGLEALTQLLQSIKKTPPH